MTEALAERTQALVPVEHGTPMPVFQGAQMAQALVAYKDLQRALDDAMPDQLMVIGEGKDKRVFRKKGYWRAVQVAFNLTVEPIEERREVFGHFADGRENFGYAVTYRATAQGRSSSGDGACTAVEKAGKFKCPHPHPKSQWKTLHFPHKRCPDYDPDFRWQALPEEATEHNIRSHAHTRAFNRAVSNLCGFGEVSAEEVDRDREREDAHVEEEPRQVGNGRTSSAERVEEQPRTDPALGPDQYRIAKVEREPKQKGDTHYILFRVYPVGPRRIFLTTDMNVAEAADKAREGGYPVEIQIEKKDSGAEIIVTLSPVSEMPGGKS